MTPAPTREAKDGERGRHRQRAAVEPRTAPERDDGCARGRRGLRRGRRRRQRRDALGKRLRRGFPRRMTADCVTQRRETPVLAGERRIIAHLALEGERGHRIELAVERSVEPEEPLVHVPVGHGSALKVLASMAAGAREPRHHRSNRRLGRFRDLAIGEAVDVAHHQRFQKGRGEARDCPAQALAIFKSDERLLRIGGGVVALTQIERVKIREIPRVSHGLAPIARHEGHRGVAHDGEKPGFRPVDRDARERGKRAQRSVLHDVLGVGRALRQPSGK